MDCWKLPQHVDFQKWSSPSQNIRLWKAINVSQLNSALGQTYETPEQLQYD